MSMPQRLRLLTIADLSPPIQGISFVTEWMLRQLRSLNFQIEVTNTTVKKKSFYYVRRTYKFLMTFIQILFKKKFDILYIPLSHGESLLFQSIFVFIGYRRNKRVIVHHHSYLPIKSPSNILHKITHGILLREAEHIFLSIKMQQDYIRVWGKKHSKFWVISNHDVATSRLISGNLKFREGNSLTFIHHGNLSTEKGVFEVIKACEPYLKSNPKIQLKILGNTKNVLILNEIDDFKLRYPNQFFYSKHYSSKLLMENLSESDIFLFPSCYKNEAAPLVVLEAQAIGVIVAATDIGTLKTEIIAPGFSVSLERFNDQLDILVSNLFTNRHRNLVRKNVADEMIQLSAKARNQVKEVFGR